MVIKNIKFSLLLMFYALLLTAAIILGSSMLFAFIKSDWFSNNLIISFPIGLIMAVAIMSGIMEAFFMFVSHLLSKK